MQGYIVAGVIIVMLGLGLWYKDDQAMTLSKENGTLAAQAAVAAERERLGKIFEQDKQDLRDAAADREAGLNTQIQDRDNDILLFQLDARERAAAMPDEYGDDFIRDLIELDCMFGLDRNAGRHDARSSCARSAEMADPSQINFPVAVWTPRFIRGIGTACISLKEDVGHLEDDDTPYTFEEWEIDNPSVGPGICDETIVVMTPEASGVLRAIWGKWEASHAQAIVALLEAEEKINLTRDQILNPPSPEDE